MDLQEIKKLLEKYRQQTCTEEERAQIEAWLNPARTGDMPADEDALEEKLRQIKLKIDLQTAPRPLRVFPIKKLAAAAAILLLIGGAAAMWIKHNTRPTLPHTIAQQAVVRRLSNGWVTISTSKGITHTVKLPDSSVVVMNANSRLRYPLTFTSNKRPVYLEEGEAFFNIASDKARPFTVYTPHFATTALGTAFNIKAYSKEQKVAISLIQGKVRVDNLQQNSASNASHILAPHEQLILDKVSARVNNTRFDEEVSITGWQQGMILLNDASKTDVINSIENKFAVTIEDRTGDTQWSYTGSFKTESLEEVLQTICMTEGIRFSLSDQNKHVVLY
ncbi:DUF4974 domain-containing protein [Chitinophaga agrisoli]|uniref:DUF4974 domain-containing protein n=1 Tax=Chitinophaga agrisoli TaxID=2607653 RepID=A0A5B2W2R8_9BACT|nr:FecR domain-containing protein [Chitinophaga agrisoli]KAA2244549.1 DUF4974 domain-containing protein [Chitinophaga agrisoli]